MRGLVDAIHVLVERSDELLLVHDSLEGVACSDDAWLKVLIAG